MMAVLFALIAGLAGLGNYSFLDNKMLALAALLLAFIALVSYRGRKTRASYQRNGTRIFTFGFAICILSLIGNIAVTVAIFWNLH